MLRPSPRQSACYTTAPFRTETCDHSQRGSLVALGVEPFSTLKCLLTQGREVEGCIGAEGKGPAVQGRVDIMVSALAHERGPEIS